MDTPNEDFVDDIVDAIMTASTWCQRLRIPVFKDENSAPEDDPPYQPDPRLPVETDPHLPRLQHVQFDVRISYSPPKMLVTGMLYGVVKKVNLIDLSHGIEPAETAREQMLAYLEENWGDVEPPEYDPTMVTQNIQTSLFELQPLSTTRLTMSSSDEDNDDGEAEGHTETKRIVFGSLHNMNKK